MIIDDMLRGTYALGHAIILKDLPEAAEVSAEGGAAKMPFRCLMYSWMLLLSMLCTTIGNLCTRPHESHFPTSSVSQ